MLWERYTEKLKFMDQASPPIASENLSAGLVQIAPWWQETSSSPPVLFNSLQDAFSEWFPGLTSCDLPATIFSVTAESAVTHSHSLPQAQQPGFCPHDCRCSGRSSQGIHMKDHAAFNAHRVNISFFFPN